MMQTNNNRTANLLGALFSLAVTDEFYLAIRNRASGGPSEAAALVEIATWPNETHQFAVAHPAPVSSGDYTPG